MQTTKKNLQILWYEPFKNTSKIHRVLSEILYNVKHLTCSDMGHIQNAFFLSYTVQMCSKLNNLDTRNQPDI